MFRKSLAEFFFAPTVERTTRELNIREKSVFVNEINFKSGNVLEEIHTDMFACVGPRAGVAGN